MIQPKPALFLDRDGIINQMVAYPGNESFDSPQSSDDVLLVDGIVNIIKWANQKNIPVIEVSNQPGVAKGKMSQLTANTIEKKVHSLLKKSKVFIDKIYFCPHLSTDFCQCRKPKPGLLLQASSELNINLSQSIILGDSSSDIEAGKAVGCKTIILLHNHNLPSKVILAKNSESDYKIKSLSQVIPILEKFF